MTAESLPNPVRRIADNNVAESWPARRSLAVRAYAESGYADVQLSSGLVSPCRPAYERGEDPTSGQPRNGVNRLVTSFQDPAAARRRLLKELKRLRFQADLTQRDVAVALDWSASKVIRVETGTVALSTTDLRALLGLYNIDDVDERADLEAMAKEARRQSSWQEFRDVTGQEAITFFGYEESCSLLRQFESLLVPGLLQTEEYARALLKNTFQMSMEDIDRQVQLRLLRQELLDRETPPELFFIVGEAAIRQQVGGSTVMRRQLEQLVALSARPHISIQVVPFGSDAYPGMRGPFVLLEFPDPADDNVLFLESRITTITRDEPDQTAGLLDIFLDMEDRATKPAELEKILFP